MGSAASIERADKVDYLPGLCGSGDEAVETHFAWVFLVGERALKLRKPVRRGTMDYSTLAARQRDSAVVFLPVGAQLLALAFRSGP